MGYKIYEFDAAIVRRPASTVSAGIRAVDQGDPTYEGVRGEHDAYVAALQEAGVQVEVLEPLEAFPDSIFVEDPALVFTIGAIVLRPGNVSRAGVAVIISTVL
jgi:dimethylargininase